MTEKTSMMVKKKTYKIIFLGPPAVGKGTQAIKMQELLGAKQLSSGDILREVVAKGDEMGQALKAIMDKGQLVPDNIICELIFAKILEACSEDGFILDGFPRTINQAKMLDELLANENIGVDAVLSLEVNDEVLIRRCLGRLVHPGSGRTFHAEFQPPIVPMTDDVTGEPLVRRSDDNEETLKRRLIAYHQQTEPLLKYYDKAGRLVKIDASKTPNKVWADIEVVLHRLG